MGKQMDQDKLKALAAELAKDIKSEKDLGTLTQQLIKLTVETALNADRPSTLAGGLACMKSRACSMRIKNPKSNSEFRIFTQLEERSMDP